MNRCLSIPLPCREKEIASSLQTKIYQFEIFENAASIDVSLWHEIVDRNNLFLNPDYFRALEKSVESNTEFRYVVIKKHHHPIGVAAFQVIEFRGDNVSEENVDDDGGFMAKIKSIYQWLSVKLINRLSVNLLVSGNCFVTGEYGIFTKDDAVSDQELGPLLEQTIEYVIEHERPRRKIAGALVKDYYEGKKEVFDHLKGKGYLEFKVNPNMILELDPSWKNYEDYLSAMTSKYRTRMKKAMKRSSRVVLRQVELEELERQLPLISDLYDQVIDNSAFKLTKLDINYVVELKRYLKDQFRFTGFFLDNQMVAFITTYLDREELVAGFMGMDREINKDYDLYLNVLLYLADEGIRFNTKRVVYGRTAMEIKSSVGARPEDMYLYTKHRNGVLNTIIHILVKMLSKNPEWQLRTPFKDDPKK